MIDHDLFEPFDKLIGIELLGRRVEVPENNRLLRCFQFLSMRSISLGDFCWNGDCSNCQFWYREPGQDEGTADKTALSCRFRVREGMRITRLSAGVRLEGLDEQRAACAGCGDDEARRAEWARSRRGFTEAAGEDAA